MSIKIQTQSATLAVLSIQLLRPANLKAVPSDLKKAAESGGYKLADTPKGTLSIRKGSARIAPSGVGSYLDGISAVDNGVRGWKLPGITDETGERITLLRALDTKLGFRVIASK